MTDRSTAVRSRSLLAGSTSIIRPKISRGRMTLRRAGCWSPRCRRAPSRGRVTSPIATGSSLASPRSGALITARLAAEAGRGVLAVPGSPLDPRAQGCNQLIRDGATLVQSAADVLESIHGLNGKVASPARPFEHTGPVVPTEAE